MVIAVAFIIEGKNLEYCERRELEDAGRSILALGELKELHAEESYIFAQFENLFGSKAIAVVPKTKAGDYLLENALCSNCRRRPLLPCVHAYAAALAAKNAERPSF